jgi:hypothetical protein
VSQSRISVAEAWGQFRNAEERKHSLLEVVTSRLVKTMTENTSVCMCVTVNCKV